jgi:tricorn protease
MILALLFSLILSSLLSTTDNYGSDNEANFMSKPSISPDGTIIYFAYEGDIWAIPYTGGLAKRVTAIDGIATAPRVSPDGKWLAFAASIEGNSNLYVLPLDGGPIRQLTFNDARDEPTSWSWDSKFIYFNSTRYNSVSTYRVSLQGGTPTGLFNHYFTIAHDAVEHPQTNELLFTNTWESFRFPSRKRYKGAFNPNITSWNLTDKTWKLWTDYPGKDMFPTVSAQGSVYFVSDRSNEEYNLFSIQNGEVSQLTAFNSSIYYPQVSASGNRIVFTKDYQLWTFDVASKQSARVPVHVNNFNASPLQQEFNVKGQITHFDVSPDGKKLAFVSRGLLFVSDNKGQFIRQLMTPTNERVVSVKWINDQRVIYTRTQQGWENIFEQQADGKGVEIRLTNTRGDDRNLSFNHDRSMLAYLSGRNEVKVLTLKTRTVKKVAQDELWGFYNTNPVFSPDGSHLVFAAIRDFERELLIVNISTKQIKHITRTAVSEDHPLWSEDGKYLYFHSNRTTPTYPSGGSDARIWRIPLHNEAPPLKSDAFDRLFSTSDTLKAKPHAVPTTLDWSTLNDRWESIGPRSGNQSLRAVHQTKNSTTVLYVSDHESGTEQLWKTVLEDFNEPKTEKIKGASTSEFIVRSNNQHYTLINGDIHQLRLSTNDTEKIEISHAFQKNLRDEFVQMFYETWANMDENFYSGDFHGVDWHAMLKKYESYLPMITTRDQLRQITNDLLGELNASHLGFNSNGEEEKVFYTTRTLETGLIFSNDNPFTVEDLLPESPADRTALPIQAGDVLVQVNQTDIDPKMNRNAYFQATRISEEISLGFNRNGTTFTVKIKPYTGSEFRNALYERWIRRNQDMVDELSKKGIAYIHMKNMGTSELERFRIEMANEAQYRNALILDLRNNTGGNVHDAVLQLLSQRAYLTWSYRDGAKTTQPNFTPSDRPIVLLVNEQSLSDAEMTTEGFKQLKLGTVIGTETYRWIIFTTSLDLVDGSNHRMPAWGCYGLDGRNLEREGVKPDIFLANTLQDHETGQDPQLKRAIEYLLEQLKAK